MKLKTYISILLIPLAFISCNKDKNIEVVTGTLVPTAGLTYNEKAVFVSPSSSISILRVDSTGLLPLYELEISGPQSTGIQAHAVLLDTIGLGAIWVITETPSSSNGGVYKAIKGSLDFLIHQGYFGVATTSSRANYVADELTVRANQAEVYGTNVTKQLENSAYPKYSYVFQNEVLYQDDNFEVSIQQGTLSYEPYLNMVMNFKAASGKVTSLGGAEIPIGQLSSLTSNIYGNMEWDGDVTITCTTNSPISLQNKEVKLATQTYSVLKGPVLVTIQTELYARFSAEAAETYSISPDVSAESSFFMHTSWQGGTTNVNSGGSAEHTKKKLNATVGGETNLQQRFEIIPRIKVYLNGLPCGGGEFAFFEDYQADMNENVVSPFIAQQLDLGYSLSASFDISGFSYDFNGNGLHSQVITSDSIVPIYISPYAIKVVSGDNQTGDTLSFLPDPIVLQVVDNLNNPIANVPVAFSVPYKEGMVSDIWLISDHTGKVQNTWQIYDLKDNVLNVHSINAEGGNHMVIEMKATGIGGKPRMGTVSDKEGNEYKTATLGTQTWMTENLLSKKFNDGTDIPWVSNYYDWYAHGSPAAYYAKNYSWYSEYKVYGNLYNWYAVETGKLCPTGWHVPTDAEWTVLGNYLGGDDMAGGKMKEAGFAHWSDPNTAATNESYFNAMPSGILYPMQPGGLIIPQTNHELGSTTYWWSSTEAPKDNPSDAKNWKAYGRELASHTGNLMSASDEKTYGKSIRCVKD